MLKKLYIHFRQANLKKADWPLLLILAFVCLQLVTLVLWANPVLLFIIAGVPAEVLTWQVLIFLTFFVLALAGRLKYPSYDFWTLTSVLISIYLIWLVVIRRDLTFSLGVLVCLACLAWTNLMPQKLRYQEGPHDTLLLQGQTKTLARPKKGEFYLGLALLFTALFIHLYFMGRLSLHRVWGFSTPTFDFGLFNQMFAYMKETGLPLTTLERDGLYSHLQVHFSPIYYLILPFYALLPRPETLQLAQLIIVCSGVIPLLLLGRHFRLPYLLQVGVGAVYLLQPGLILGSFFDLHENCFLAPLICWLFWAIFKGKFWLSLAFSALLLLVKEDAALYLVSAGLFVVFTPLLAGQKYQIVPQKNKPSFRQAQSSRQHAGISAAQLGLFMCFLGLGGFLLISNFLEESGEGLMSYRFAILQQYGGAGILGILRSVFQNPAQALGIIFAPEKLSYLLSLILATGFLPFLQVARSHYLLFLPLLVMNLATDYPYQYDIFFQYNYGSHTFLIIALLLAIVSMIFPQVDLGKAKSVEQAQPQRGHKKGQIIQATALLLGVAVLAAASFSLYYMDSQKFYIDKYQENPQLFQDSRKALELIPRDKVIGADSFATTFLADCPQLYDLEFNQSVAFGRDLDILVHAKINNQNDPWIDTVWAYYQSKGYVERPDLSADGLLEVLSKPELMEPEN